MICSSSTGSITNNTAILAGTDFVVSVSASVGSASTNAAMRIVCKYEGASGSEERLITGLPTVANRFTFYPTNASGKSVWVGVELTGVPSGNSVTIANVYKGSAWLSGETFPCTNGVGDSWNAGTPNAYWANNATKAAFQADVRTKSSTTKSLTTTYYQLSPPLSDNIQVSFDIFNEAGDNPNDYVQVFASTNSWNGSKIAVGASKPRYEATTTNGTWRSVTVEGYIPGIKGIDTFQIGVEAQPGGGSLKYITSIP